MIHSPGQERYPLLLKAQEYKAKEGIFYFYTEGECIASFSNVLWVMLK